MEQHPLSLEPLSLPEVPAGALVEIAGHVGFDYVSLFLNPPAPTLPADAIVADLTLRRATMAAMKRFGVRLLNIECFNLTAEARVDDFAIALACGHELGALTASVIVNENDDRSDILKKFNRLCDMAAEMSIRVNVEFFAMSKSMGTLEAATALVRDSHRANAAVVIDVLHLIRTGGSIDVLTVMDPNLIGAAQISDGPLLRPESEFHDEAASNRQVPGAGEFPLKAFLAALPRDIIVGVEVPLLSLAGKVTPDQRARMLIDATRALYR